MHGAPKGPDAGRGSMTGAATLKTESDVPAATTSGKDAEVGTRTWSRSKASSRLTSAATKYSVFMTFFFNTKNSLKNVMFPVLGKLGQSGLVSSHA